MKSSSSEAQIKKHHTYAIRGSATIYLTLANEAAISS
jgi:hypothetical protein